MPALRTVTVTVAGAPWTGDAGEIVSASIVRSTVAAGISKRVARVLSVSSTSGTAPVLSTVMVPSNVPGNPNVLSNVTTVLAPTASPLT